MFNMASNKPVTFEQLVNRQAEANGGWFEVRPHTEAIMFPEEDHFEVFLYGSRIADVFPESVRVYRPKPTATTKNRINDLLTPLGWKVVVRSAKWHVQTTKPPYRSMEFIPGMIL
jgi:hypothetical protein